MVGKHIFFVAAKNMCFFFTLCSFNSATKFPQDVWDIQVLSVGSLDGPEGRCVPIIKEDFRCCVSGGESGTPALERVQIGG